MKKLIVIIYLLLFISAFLTQLTMFIIEHTALIRYRTEHMPLLVLAIVTPIAAFFLLYFNQPPRLPSHRLSEILRTEGYTAELYKILSLWEKKCIKRDYKEYAALSLAQTLIDGGHCNEGFQKLKEINYRQLSKEQKKTYCNTALYGAVISGDLETADEIFRRSGMLLISSRGSQAPSIMHTLGCYEYMKGNKKKAEILFCRTLAHAKSAELSCDAQLALSACYADRGYLMRAKAAVEKASEYAVTVPMKTKLERAKEMVEQAFRERTA